MTPQIVAAVGTPDDLTAVRWALDEARRTGERVRVVHATTTFVAVDDAMPESIATALGRPFWAMIGREVDQLAESMGIPMRRRRQITVVASARPVDLIAQHAANARLLVLGPETTRPRWRRRRSIGAAVARRLTCEIVRTALPSAMDSRGTIDPRPPARPQGMAVAA